MTTTEILSKIKGIKRTGNNQWAGLCPGHEDKSASLSISERDGTALIFCHAGCDYKTICEAINISPKDLFFGEASYQYGGTATKLKYRNPITREKTFAFKYADGKKPTSYPLFYQPSLEAIIAATRVFLCEGEKDAITIAGLGLAACSGHTSGLPNTCDISPLRGKEIVIVIDNDKAGMEHAIKCAKRLILESINSGPILKWEVPSWAATLPEEEKVKDISDYAERSEDITKEKLEGEIEVFPQTILDGLFGSQSDQKAPESEIPLHEMEVMKTKSRPDPIAEDAYKSYLGKLVLSITDRTEAHRDPILTQVITKLGSAMAAHTTVPMSGGKSPILFNLVVGESGTGRKGTTLEVANSFVDAILNYELPTLHAISTPEGIIQYAQTFCPQSVTNCPYPLLTIEVEEFSGLFKIAKRDANPIFQMIRRFWDSPKKLQVPTRRDPLSIDNPKISITGHITPTALKKHLASEEIDGGTVNRFIFTWSERDKKTEYFDLTDEITSLCKPIKEKIEASMGIPLKTKLSEAAREIWLSQKEKYYDSNDNISSRHLGNLTRIATIIATIDPENPDNIINQLDMNAAIAILEHSYKVFNYMVEKEEDTSINERELLNLLSGNKDGLATRTEIYNHFGRNMSSAEISKAIDQLSDKGMVSVEKRKGKFKPTIVVRKIG
jgi:hypothetical protein